jgi:hypothetical protein
MVAFCSSRRKRVEARLPKQPTAESLAACRAMESRGSVAAAASRRRACGYEVVRNRDGGIASVRIGSWRELTAGPQRRLAEVRQLTGERVAVRIERFADGGDRPTSEIWQLYDLQGRLDAAIQTTPDGKFAVLTNYRTRQSCRLVRNAQGELETVETWSI